MVPPVSASWVGSMLVNKLEEWMRSFEDVPRLIETEVASTSLKKDMGDFLISPPLFSYGNSCTRKWHDSGEKFVWIITASQRRILFSTEVLKKERFFPVTDTVSNAS